jgi:hypothetical protein
MYRVLRQGGRVALSFDRYPDEEKARKAEGCWWLPTWTEPKAVALIEAAGFSQLTPIRTKNNLFVAAVKP